MIYSILLTLCLYGMWIVYKDVIYHNRYIRGAKTIFEKRRTDLELWIMKNNKSELDKDLFKSSIILKNLALVRKDTPFSADYMYEKLVENSGLLKPIYSQMMTLYRNKRDVEAFKIIPLIVGTKASKSFAIILSKLEILNPAEMESQMDLFQKSMMESRMTSAIKRVQRNSMILTIMATATIFALLLNFVVVVVFMSTLEMLNSVFL